MADSHEPTCPVCGGSAWRTVLGGQGFSIDTCASGCIARTAPPPEYCADLPPDARAENLTQVRPGASGHFTFANRILDLIGRWQPGGRLLDIGSGWGQLLKSASDRGYDALGLEASAGVADIARQAFGVKAVVGVFPERTFEPESFDVVVMNHVLEHLYDPRAALADVVRILRPGGVFAVCSPDFQSLMRTIKRTAWQGLQPDQHVWQLSTESIRMLMTRAGLVPICANRSSLDYNRGSGSLPKWLALRAILMAAQVLGTGDNTIVLARKPRRIESSQP